MNYDDLKKMLDAAGPGAHLSTVGGPRAHRVVARSAKEYCAALYDLYCSKWPEFRQAFPSENDFVRRFWAHFIGPARATLAQMLASNIREDLKAEIYDGLIRDQSLAATRKNVPQITLD